MKTQDFARQAKTGNNACRCALPRATSRALRSGVTAQVDGDQRPLDITQELTKFDAAPQTAGIDPAKSRHSRV